MSGAMAGAEVSRPLHLLAASFIRCNCLMYLMQHLTQDGRKGV
jgi:hypothetical protein